MYLQEFQKLFVHKLLDKFSESESMQVFKILLEDFFKMSKFEIIENKQLSNEQIKQLNICIERLKSDEPTQYITNTQYFLEYPFYVDSRVLIPRPETEELTAHIIEENKQIETLKILDIGTGSGCIAIALDLKLIHSKVYGYDKSLAALEVAKINNKKLESNVQFKQFDILSNSAFSEEHKLNIIVSNPPYIDNSEENLMSTSTLKYEPNEALFVKIDPLEFYISIISYAEQNLVKNGKLYFECNEFFATDVFKLFDPAKWKNKNILKDLQGKNRFVSANLNK